MNQRQELVRIFGQQQVAELEQQIPERFRVETVHNFSEYLLQKSEQEILNFYEPLMNSTEIWNLPKICGDVILFSSHIHDLLIQLVNTRETDETIISLCKKLDLHHLILFATARYTIPQDYFEEMMKLKHFRNLIAHNFNEVLSLNQEEAIAEIARGPFLVIVLVGMIRGE